MDRFHDLLVARDLRAARRDRVDPADRSYHMAARRRMLDDVLGKLQSSGNVDLSQVWEDLSAGRRWALNAYQMRQVWNKRLKRLLVEGGKIRRNLHHWAERALALHLSVEPPQTPARRLTPDLLAQGMARAKAPYERVLRALERDRLMGDHAMFYVTEWPRQGRQHEPWKRWIRGRLARHGVPVGLHENLLKAVCLVKLSKSDLGE